MHSLKRRGNWCTISPIINAFLIIILFYIVLCVTLFAGNTQEAHADGVAECAAELNTGKILYAKNDSAKLPMASTTKIMTALIIIEECELDEVITVPDEAVGVEGSSIYLKKGERVSVRDLLYGLMLRSGNDSAVALAIHHSGSVQNFAARMNERALQLGADDTHFVNPSGLPDDEHFTTARDLCAIACAAMRNDTFKAVVSSKSYTGQFRSFVNKNKALYSIDGANGVKTGYTLKAGRCLVASAERDGMDVVCVVLNCPDMYERCQKLIEDAFSKYEIKVIAANKVFMCGEVPCIINDTHNLLIPTGAELIVKTVPNDRLQIIKGGEAGIIEIYCENDLIFSAKLYSIVNKKTIY